MWTVHSCGCSSNRDRVAVLALKGANGIWNLFHHNLWSRIINVKKPLLSKSMALGHVVELSGLYLDGTAALDSHLKVRSVRFISHMLRKRQLTSTEQSLLAAYCDGHVHASADDPFPALRILPDFKNSTGCLLS